MITDPIYYDHCYDILIHLSVDHKYTQLILNRVLNVGDNTHGGKGHIQKVDSALIESISNKKWSGIFAYHKNSINAIIFWRKHATRRHILAHPQLRIGLIMVNEKTTILVFMNSSHMRKINLSCCHHQCIFWPTSFCLGRSFIIINLILA